MSNFGLRLSSAFGTPAEDARFADWLPAMAKLTEELERALAQHPEAKVVFFDELPWLASRRSGFLKAFGWFWNSWAAQREIVVVICGSAASWMIGKVVRSRGSLHNRITHRITLDPFRLGETFAYMDARGLVSDVYQRVQLYMALGGVPFYLKQLEAGETAQQSIERLLFGKQAPLAGEFDLLYASLFDDATHHRAVVEALASKQVGLTRTEVGRLAGIQSSGTLARVLEALELSSFIYRSTPFGKRRKDALYRLIDEYSRFYLQGLAGRRSGTVKFADQAASPAFRSWSGYAFENLALRHADEIRRALGIAGISANACSYVARETADAGGVQVDILLDRADRAVSIVEAKFSADPFWLTKEYATKLRQKRTRFIAHTATRKQVYLVLLTVYGVETSPGSIGIVDQVLTVEDLL